jgi:Ca-activated chloride channel family protein
MRRLVVTLVALAVTALEAQQPTFKGGVELVTVPVTVKSLDHSTYIDGLSAADFRLSENGDRQVIASVTRERRPVSLCFVVDSSGSMGLGTRKDMAVEAAQRIIGALAPDDEIAIVFFADQVEERLPWTRVRDITKLSWSGWVPRGTTALNDGLRLGFTLIEKANNPRRAIVLITDGFENASRESTSSVVKTRQQSETTIFGVGVGSASIADMQSDVQHIRPVLPGANAESLRRMEAIAPGATETVRTPNALPAFDYLETLVGDSGGIASRAVSFPEVILAAKNIVNELQYEYLLGYEPTKAFDGKYRRVKVEMNRRGLFIRYRGGYLALPSQAPPPKPQEHAPPPPDRNPETGKP